MRTYICTYMHLGAAHKVRNAPGGGA